MPNNYPTTLIGRAGYGALLLALVLAPLVAGYPAGTAYNADVPLGATRCLVFVAALCLFLAPGQSGTKGKSEPGATLLQRLPSLAAMLVGGAVGLAVISFLVQSQFFTSPVLLFASLPGMLDWLCFGLLFALGLRFGRGSAAFGMVGALVVGGAITGIVSVLEYGQFVQVGMPQQRAQGVFFSPNFAAGLLALTLPLVLALYLGRGARILQIVLGATMALMAGALFASGSRAGVVFAVVGCLVPTVIALISGKPADRPFRAVAVLIPVLLVLAFAFRGPLMQRVEAAGQEQSGPFRSWTWKGTLNMAKAHPILGTGPGTYPYLYPRYAIVAKTDLAHSSYLQTAAEEGFPVLAAVVAAAALLLLAGAGRLAQGMRIAQTEPLLLLVTGGLLGGVIAALARSLFDSEWSILGNALPFWTVLGLLAGMIQATPEEPVKTRARSATQAAPLSPLVMGGAALAFAGLVLAYLCLNTAQQRAQLLPLVQMRRPIKVDSYGWPTDPQLLFYDQKLKEAAEIEPTGKRYYQYARYRADKGDLKGAVESFKTSVALEPTSLQSWRRLAEAQERAQDTAGALESWRKLTELYEGPVGKIRAIPESTETHPAFAYAALARAALEHKDMKTAAGLYAKAAAIVESYARTPLLYQQMEITNAQVSGISIPDRRAEIQKLYQQVMDEWSLVDESRFDELTKRRKETIDLLNKMVMPNNLTP